MSILQPIDVSNTAENAGWLCGNSVDTDPTPRYALKLFFSYYSKRLYKGVLVRRKADWKYRKLAPLWNWEHMRQNA